jgi:hypothetical protein
MGLDCNYEAAIWIGAFDHSCCITWAMCMICTSSTDFKVLSPDSPTARPAFTHPAVSKRH